MHRFSGRDFFARDAREVARDLLGCLIIRRFQEEQLILRITETEAYLGPEDLASHSRGGRVTRRNQVMFGEAGHVYMFLVYGMHHCFNITAGKEGRPEAVLIRAGEALAGKETMLENRGLLDRTMTEKKRMREIASGPGKLSRALGLDLGFNGLDLAGSSEESELFIGEDGFTVPEQDIVEDVRIGIDYAGEYAAMPWRYYLKDNDSVSITREKRLRKEELKL